jgi:hypothetical protein
MKDILAVPTGGLLVPVYTVSPDLANTLSG